VTFGISSLLHESVSMHTLKIKTMVSPRFNDGFELFLILSFCMLHNVLAAAFRWRCLPAALSTRHCRLYFLFSVLRATGPPLKAEACYKQAFLILSNLPIISSSPNILDSRESEYLVLLIINNSNSSSLTNRSIM